MNGLIVINADDLGMNPEVNAGILSGLHQGVISDTSLLVKGDYVEPAVGGLKALGIEHAGIHINLDDLFGWKPGGIECHPRVILMEMLRKKEFLTACAREARDQIEYFLDFNLTPTHLDSHHHVHGFPAVFDMLLRLMGEFGIPAMRFSRHGYQLPTRIHIPYDPEIFLQMENGLKDRGIHFCKSYMENARNISKVGMGVTELVVHPSISGDAWRSEELEFLLSDHGVESLLQKGIRLISYQDLLMGH
jgi:predicted glycoside hydrolase/deacetylase ChbG (UPF0249 family)